MARSISSSISTLRSSLSDIRTAFGKVNVSVPSNLKVSQVDDYINQIDAKYPANSLNITGPDFNSYLKSLDSSCQNIENVIFVPQSPYFEQDTGWRKDGTKCLLDFFPGPGYGTPKTLFVIYFDIDRGTSDVLSRPKLVSGYQMFSGLTNLKYVNLSLADFSAVSDCDSMFRDCSSLKFVDFSGCDLRNLKDMRNMFNGCTSLEWVRFDQRYLIKPTYLQNMFYGCTNLFEVNLPFNPAGISDMSSTFYNCRSLKRINVLNDYKDWTTNSSVANSANTFYGVTSLDMSWAQGIAYSSSKTSGQYAKYYGGYFDYIFYSDYLT